MAAIFSGKCTTESTVDVLFHVRVEQFHIDSRPAVNSLARAKDDV